MWPWEHVVIGYLAYSAATHLWRRVPPRADEAALVAFASLLPDLIDKPLAWSLQLVSSGYGPAHSIFVVLPAMAALSAYWRTTGQPWRAVAFGTGYLLHVPGDVVLQATDGTVEVAVFLWPVIRFEPSGEPSGFLTESTERISEFLTGVFAGDVSTYMAIQLGLLAVAALVWLYDGAPVLWESLDWTTRRLWNR